MMVSERTAAEGKKQKTYFTIKPSEPRQSGSKHGHKTRPLSCLVLIFYREHMTTRRFFSRRCIHPRTGASGGRWTYAEKNEYEVTAYVSGHERNHCIQEVRPSPLTSPLLTLTPVDRARNDVFLSSYSFPPYSRHESHQSPLHHVNI